MQEASDLLALESLLRSCERPHGGWWKEEWWATGWAGEDIPLGDWNGVLLDAEGRVVILDLRATQHSQILDCQLPVSELLQLSALRRLDLAGNALTGPLPAGLGQLGEGELSRLCLAGNALTGPLPAELAQLTSLTHLLLDNNQFTGVIPAELGHLTALIQLDISGNQLAGAIPAELGQLGTLRWLGLSGNALSGKVPAELMKMRALTHLYLLHNCLVGMEDLQLYLSRHNPGIIFS
jgi:hypothetical protein